jgi:hypothetical protein
LLRVETEEEPVVDTFDATEEGAPIVGAPLVISGCHELPLITLVSMVLGIVDMPVSRVSLVNVAVEAVEVGSAFWGSSLGGLENVDAVAKVVEVGLAVTCWLLDALK